eukprot:TRINITY_DN4362_c1_g1_i1.p1 TRINITY_DN4362_c1_g1~~TRINITY_DN4362_c1_g1_i1.p1  ORF type:complete len:271 (-),score=67.19 TRINITY_DN4362_c1_g1_i1:77-802(-)
MPKFQLKLGERWEDFVEREDEILQKAFMSGKKFAEFHSRGQDYYCDFQKMVQRNVKTGKERPIRIVYDEDGKKKPDKKPEKLTPPAMPAACAAQALHGAPVAGRPPVVQGAVVGYAPGGSPGGHAYDAGPAYSPASGAPPPYAAGAPAYAGGAPAYAGGAPAYAAGTPAYGAPGAPCGAAPAYGAYGAPVYGGAPAPAYGPPPGGAGGMGGMGGMGGGGGAMLAAGGAGLLGGLLLGEIFD